MRPIRPGKYRNVVYVQKNEPLRNADGRWIDSWVDHKKKFAKKKPLNSKDYFDAKAANAVLTVVWQMRYDPSIKGNMRLIEKNSDGSIKEAYDIVGDPLDMEGLNREMEVITEAVMDSGS